MTLYAPTLAGRKQWADKIEGQRRALVEKHKVFNVQPINESFFSAFNKVNCIAVFGKTFYFLIIILYSSSYRKWKIARLGW